MITNPKINIYQIYYDSHTRNQLEPGLIPYYNQVKDNYYENNVIIDIYNRNIEADFIGITSPRFKEKTQLTAKELLKIVEQNKEKDVIIYAPDYTKLYNGTHLEGKRVDIWKFNDYKGKQIPYPDIYKTAEILNKRKYLPFDIFEKDWTYCYCNYWIAKKYVFDDYCKNVLLPTIQVMEEEGTKEKIDNMALFHRDKTHKIHTFVLEAMFGTYLSNNNYNIYNHFVNQ